jgi:glycosyltransferase involved in cell wall biosynthesis
MKLVIVVPAYNEARTIGLVIRAIPRFPAPVTAQEVIVVDDGSTDDTTTQARAAGAEVVSHGTNRGVGTAISTGMREALKRGADIMAHLDADGQFNPRDLLKIVAPLLDRRADIVTATRFVGGKAPAGMPAIKVWGNRMITRLINWATRQNFSDVSCGLRAYSREALLRLTLFGQFTYTQEVFLDAAEKNLRIAEVPVEVRGQRQFGTSRVYRNAWAYAGKSLLIIFRTLRDVHPFLAFSVPALVLTCLGIAALAAVVFFWWFGVADAFVPVLLIIGCAMLLTAFILFQLGLLADIHKRERKILEELLYWMRRGQYRRHA